MALRSSLFASLSTRGIAASAAAVLMVGGGVAVAQSTGTEPAPSEDGEEAPEEEVETLNGDDDDAGTEGDIDDLDKDIEEPPAEIQELQEEDEDEPIDVPEIATEEGDGDGAEAFSTWVESLPDDWGCLKGQLVSHFARQGPTNFSEGGSLAGELPEIDPETDGVGDALKALGIDEGNEVEDLPGRCAERILDGGEDEMVEDDAEVEGSSAESNRPEGAGRPARDADGKPEHAGESGPPPHAKGNGDGPGKSGDARGRAGKGNGES